MSGSSHARRQTGYVLVLTLVLLALVAAGLARIARHSHRASMYATQLERQAQRDWLTWSAQDLLPKAETILDEIIRDPETLPRTSKIEINVDLGHHAVRFTLADEQAKANLNSLWDRYEPAVFHTKAQELAAASGWSDRIEPRPIGEFEATAADSEIDWPAFVAFEQVLSADQLVAHLQQSSASVLDALTLWGNGQLLWKKASSPVLEAVLTPLLSPGQVAQLASEDFRGRSFEDLDLTDRQIERLTPLITESSGCFSARLRFDDGRRVRTTLLVQESTEDKQTPLIRFSW